MAFASGRIPSSILEPAALSISLMITEGPGALSDFIAFSAVDIMLCMISGVVVHLLWGHLLILPHPKGTQC